MFEITGHITKVHPTRIIDRFFKITDFELSTLSSGKGNPQVRLIQGHKKVCDSLSCGEFKAGDIVTVSGEMKGFINKQKRIVNVDEAYSIRRA